MTVDSYYALLDVAANASAEDIKKAFRQLITRYHPDKVQHLGKEFQDLAADRAAQLTHAYTVLSDPGRRAEYDSSHLDGSATSATSAAPAGAAPPAAAGSPAAPASAPSSSASEPDAQRVSQFAQERTIRDEFVKRATLGRFRQAVIAAAPQMYDEWKVQGFDVAYIPKATTLKSSIASSFASSLFKRGAKPPRLAAQFPPRVDRRVVAAALELAGTWQSATIPDLCIFLIGSELASAVELAQPIAEQRAAGRGKTVTVIPVDSRDWSAYVPLEVPAVAKSLVKHLQGAQSR